MGQFHLSGRKPLMPSSLRAKIYARGATTELRQNRTLRFQVIKRSLQIHQTANLMLLALGAFAPIERALIRV